MTGRVLDFEDVMRWIEREHRQRLDNLEWFKKRVERTAAR
jgi:hypothetical protein